MYLLAGSALLAEAAGPLWLVSDGAALYPRSRQLFVFDRELGYRLRPRFQLDGDANHLYPGVELTINRDGMRSAEPDGRPLALVVGDSVAFGFGLPAERALAARLQRRLGEGTQVLNAGIPGYNVEQLRRWTERLVARFAPRAVILLLNANDAQARYEPTRGGQTLSRFRCYPWEKDRPVEAWHRRDPHRRWLLPAAARQLRSGQGIAAWRRPPRGAADTPRIEKRQLREVRFWQSGAPAASGRLEVARAHGLALVESLRAAHIRVVVARVPWRVAVTRRQHDALTDWWLAPLRAVAGVTAIDLAPALRAAESTRPQFLPGDDHPSAAGHDTMAAGLAAALGGRSEAALVSCPRNAYTISRALSSPGGVAPPRKTPVFLRRSALPVDETTSRSGTAISGTRH